MAKSLIVLTENASWTFNERWSSPLRKYAILTVDFVSNICTYMNHRDRPSLHMSTLQLSVQFMLNSPSIESATL